MKAVIAVPELSFSVCLSFENQDTLSPDAHVALEVARLRYEPFPELS